MNVIITQDYLEGLGFSPANPATQKQPYTRYWKGRVLLAVITNYLIISKAPEPQKEFQIHEVLMKLKLSYVNEIHDRILFEMKLEYLGIIKR